MRNNVSLQNPLKRGFRRHRHGGDLPPSLGKTPRGRASAPCGIGLIGSYATGVGAVLTVAERFQVQVVDGSAGGSESNLMSRLVKATADILGNSSNITGVFGHPPVPTGVGLKTSSAVATATVSAAAGAARVRLSDAELVEVSAAAQRACGLTNCGSVDDTWASVVAGIVIAETATKRLLSRLEPPVGLLAIILVPPGPPPAVHRVDRRALLRPYAHYFRFLLERFTTGDFFGSTTAAAFVTSGVFGYSPKPLLIALAAGAFAVSLSGKGPARAALSDASGCDRIARAWRRAYPTATIVRTSPTLVGAVRHGVVNIPVSEEVH